MISESWVVSALLVFTNIFWALVTTALVNRLMSRNYFEFKEASLIAEKKAGKLMGEPQEFQAVDDQHFGSVQEIMQ